MSYTTGRTATVLRSKLRIVVTRSFVDFCTYRLHPTGEREKPGLSETNN